jgi:hypothetical protein
MRKATRRGENRTDIMVLYNGDRERPRLTKFLRNCALGRVCHTFRPSQFGSKKGTRKKAQSSDVGQMSVSQHIISLSCDS